MNIKIAWADNTADLKRNLAAGLDQITATREAAEKMVQALSGDKLITAAHRMTAAINEVGGVTKLTAAEQARANALIEKAIEKYEALGKTAPSALRELAEATKQVSHESENWTSKIVAGVAGGELFKDAIEKVVEGVIEAVKVLPEMVLHTVELGASLYEMSLKSGASVEKLSALRYAASQTGVQFDSLTTLMYRMQVALGASGEKADKVKEVLGKLNLDLQTLKNEKPDQAFLDIVSALQEMPNRADQAALGMQIFGKSFKDLTGLIAQGDLKGLLADAERLGLVMSTETASAAKVAEEAWRRLSLQFEAAGTQMSATVIPALATLEQLASEAFAELMRGYKASGGLFADGTITKSVVEIGETIIQATAAMAGFAAGATEGLKFVVDAAIRVGEAFLNIGELGVRIARLNPAAWAGPLKRDIDGVEHTLKNSFDALEILKGGFASGANVAEKAFGAVQAVTDRMAGKFGESYHKTQEEIAHLADVSRNAAGGIGRDIEDGTGKAAKALSALDKAREQAAADNARADAMETDGLLNAISTRMDALDAEHAERVANMSADIKDAKERALRLEAEEISYQAKRRLLEAEGAAAVQEIVRASASEIAKIEAGNKTLSLAERKAALDDEVYAQQQAALKKIGYTDDEWKAEYAIYLEGETKKQKLVDDYDKRALDAERKLIAEIAGIDEQAATAGISRKIAELDTKQRLDIADLEKENLEVEEYLRRRELIDDKYDKLRRNARTENARKTDKELAAIEQQSEDTIINLMMTGMERELALNEAHRQRRIKQLQDDAADPKVIEKTQGQFDLQARAIVASFDPIHKAWLGLNADLRQEWADTWTKALEQEGSFVNALESPFKQIEKQWLTLLGAMLADWENQFIKKLTGIDLAGGGLKNLFNGLGGGAGDVGPTLGQAGKYGAGGEGDQGPNLSMLGAGVKGTAGKLLGGGAMAGMGLMEWFKATGLGGNIMGGAETGAGIGTMILPGIGTAIGAGLGALAGLVKGLFGGSPEWQKLQSDIGRDFGVKITDEMAKGMEAESKIFGRQATSLLHLDELITAAGGVKDFGIDKAISKAHDLFSMLDTGKLTAEQVGQEFDKVFAQILPEAIDKTTGFAKDSFLELVRVAKASGIESQAVTDFINQQTALAATGFSAIATNTVGLFNKVADAAAKATGGAQTQRQALDAVNQSGMQGQETFDRLGRLAVVAFNDAISSGKGFLEAIESIGPGLDQLSAAQQKFGLTSSGTFDELMKFRQFADNNKELIGTLDGVNQMMVGLKNTGMLDQQTFDDLNAIATETFTKMVAGGLSGDQAIRAMQPTLQRIWELQQEFGYAVDESTQKLLDQAVQAGAVGEKHKSAAERTVDAMNHVADTLDKIAEKLGVELPKAADKAAAGVESALDGIKVPDIKLPVSVDVPAGGFKIPIDWYTNNFPTPPSTGSTGGLVTPHGIVQHFAAGGIVRSLGPIGTDTVPAWLTPGEIVMTPMQVAETHAVMAQGLEIARTIAADRGSTLVVPSITIEVHGEMEGKEILHIATNELEAGGVGWKRIRSIVKQMVKS